MREKQETILEGKKHRHPLQAYSEVNITVFFGEYSQVSALRTAVSKSDGLEDREQTKDGFAQIVLHLSMFQHNLESAPSSGLLAHP